MSFPRRNGSISTFCNVFVVTLFSVLICAVPALSAATKKPSKPAAKPVVKPAQKTAKPAAPKPDEKPVEFMFLPGDGTTFIETCKSKNIISDNGMRYIPEFTEYKSKYTITRTTDGYHVVRTPISYDTTNVDEDTMNAIIDRFMRTNPIEYDIELIGDCSTVTGVGKIVEQIRAKASEMQAKYEKKLRELEERYIREAESPEDAAQRQAEVEEARRIAAKAEEESVFALVNSIVASEQSQWDSKYSQLIGLVIKPHVIMKDSVRLPIFRMASPGTSEIQVTGMQKVDGHDCAILDYNLYTNKNKPDKYTAQILKWMFLPYSSTETNNFNVSRYSASMKMKYVMDPATMLIYSSEVMSKGVLEITLDNDVVSSMIIEQSEERTYEYLKPETEKK